MSERNAKLVRKFNKTLESAGAKTDEGLLKKLLAGSHKQRQRIRKSMQVTIGRGKAKRDG